MIAFVAVLAGFFALEIFLVTGQQRDALMGLARNHAALDLDSFDMDQVDIVINALPADRIRLAMDLGWVHGTNTEFDQGAAVVEYAFAEYTFQDWLKVRGGKVQTPFGIYNEIHNAKPLMMTVKEPNATTKNDKFGSDYRFFPRFSTGVSLLGGIGHDGQGDYVLMLSNGDSSVENPSEVNDNSSYGLTARVRYSPLANLDLGVSFYNDVLSMYDDEGDQTGALTDLTSYGVFAKYEIVGLGLELEVVSGSYKTDGADKVSRTGLTAMVFYPIMNRFTPYFRYEYYEPNKDVADDTVNLFIYGINIRISELLILKAELNTLKAGEANDRFKDGNNDYTEFKAAAVLSF